MKFIRSKLPSGEFVSLANDTYVGRSLSMYGEWSYGEIELLQQVVGQDSNVVEVGANIGSHTVFIARDLCPQGRVFAFEPRRVIFQTLCSNLVLNEITNVDARACAIGETTSVMREASIPVGHEANFGAFSLKENAAGEEIVPIIPLDSLMDDLPTIRVIKADVEGFELQVVKGAHQLIARDRPFLYLENDRIELSQTLLEHVAALGYRIYWHSVPLYRANNFCNNPHNIFPHTVSLNIACIPEEMEISVAGLPLADDFTAHPLKP